MAHAQIQLYPDTPSPDPLTSADYAAAVERWDTEAIWGWRKVILVEPPEVIEDSGLIFTNRADAMADAQKRFPNWGIG